MDGKKCWKSCKPRSKMSSGLTGLRARRTSACESRGVRALYQKAGFIKYFRLMKSEIERGIDARSVLNLWICRNCRFFAQDRCLHYNKSLRFDWMIRMFLYKCINNVIIWLKHECVVKEKMWKESSRFENLTIEWLGSK